MKELDDIARALSSEMRGGRASLRPRTEIFRRARSLQPSGSGGGTKREEDAVKAFKRAIYLKPDFMEARASQSRMIAGSDFETALRVIEEGELAPGGPCLNAMTVCLIG